MIKHIMATAVLWFAVAAVFPLYAQQQKKENTLGSLWPTVENNYPGIGVKTSAADAAKLNERAVRSNVLPQVKAQAQSTYGTHQGSAGAFFPQPGFFNVSGVTAAGSSTAASTFGSAIAEWELFSFGKLRKQNQAARALYSKSVSEKEAYLLGLKKELSKRYITHLYNVAKLIWTKKNAARLDDIRKITSGLSASGLRPAADSLLAGSSYLQAMGLQDKWTGFKKASLIKLLELSGNQTFNYLASASRFRNPSTMYAGLESAVDPAHPILEALELQSDYYMQNGMAQKSASLPSISLLGGYAYRGTGIGANGAVSGAWKDGFSNSANNFLVGVGITWDLTSLHTNRLKKNQFFKQAESTKLRQAQYEQAMQADLSAAQTNITQQYQQLQKTRIAVKQSEDGYQMYLARYKSGLIGLSELLQIRTLLERAEDDHTEAARDYWMLLAYHAELTANFEFLFNNL